MRIHDITILYMIEMNTYWSHQGSQKHGKMS